MIVPSGSSGRRGHPLPKVPRWTGQQRPTIQDASFIGPTSADANRPIFFLGYGHFAQARNDIEKFPAYGINIVQHGEFGPAQVFPAENEIDDTPVLAGMLRKVRHLVKVEETS